jgi:hypothetical protein
MIRPKLANCLVAPVGIKINAFSPSCKTATEMPLVQQKTDVKAHVQIHSEYRQIIEAARPKADDKVVALHEDAVAPLPSFT